MRDLRSEILENKKLAEGIYRMTLETPKSEFTRPGQFAMVEVPDKFLRRPISVSSYDSSRYTLIYKGLEQNGFTVVNLDKDYKLDASKFLSLGKCTPFDWHMLNGLVELTIMNGKIVYENLEK